VRTLASIAAQIGVPFECLVVEQSPAPEIADDLPRWCRYLHTPTPPGETRYSRSWAFNIGARHARGRFLIFHDNDVCVPERYAAEVARVLSSGFVAARLHRFVFYLSEEHTREVVAGSSDLAARAPVSVVQNCQGHSLAVERETYFDIGGHDESFLGWGGEDNEIFERCAARALHEGSYLPFVHLHHPPQAEKTGDRAYREYLDARLATPAETRIAELRARTFGAGWPGTD
jgi:hypothetical protein